ncbi:EF-hand [Atractiella rhizophila]|nr:EF-hand [Atractiella rhizophila]
MSYGNPYPDPNAHPPYGSQQTGGGGYGSSAPGGGYGGGGGGYGGGGGGGYGSGGGGGGYGGGHGPSHGGGGGYGPPSGGPPPHQGGGYPPQGHSGRPPAPPPAGDHDPNLYGWFKAVDHDRSGHISAQELQQALVNGDWSPFDLDTVKLLMSIFDVDRQGTIDFNEFQGLWKYIRDWQNVFRHFDADNSGTIEATELSRALSQFGYNLSPRLISILEKKYDVKKAGTLPQRGGKVGGITFDRFVRCCVVVKSLTESFQKLDTDRDGWVQMSYEQFLDMVLSAP